MVYTKGDTFMKKTLCQVSLVIGLCIAVSAVAGPGLADGASKFVGNITQSNQVPAVNSQFSELWNQATAENGCKWGSVEGTRGRYNWAGCDAAYQWAKQTGGYFKFHALVWGSQYPSWLPSLDVNATKQAITEWFDAVAERYPDAHMIDVVNEAIRTGNNTYHSNYGQTKIIQALGGDNNGDYAFITTAFKMARERWPNAILIYNDYNTFQWQKNEGIDLINTIKRNGAPVDAYGQQAHDMMSQGGGAGGIGGGGVCLNYNTFKSTLQEIYDKTQIPLFISEYDISTTNDAVQKQCYEEQIGAFMEAPYVAGITLWGYIYGQTWTTNGESGIIRNGQDRPAMTWLRQYLASNKGVNTTKFQFGGGGFTSPANVRIEEQTTAVTKLTTSLEGSATYTIEGGDDAALFALSGADLAFKTAPSFASPSDKDKNGAYKVTVKASAGGKSATLDMTVTVTQKQAAYNGTTPTLPGRIEAEEFDVCGEECAYHDSDTENEGDATLRNGEGVDVVQIGTGSEYAIGYTTAGEWLEYTVNVENEAVYTLKARVASGNENSSFRLFIGDQAITDTVKVPAGADWDTYSDVEIKTSKLTKGTHVIKLAITGSYVNIDWLEFNDGTIGIGKSLDFNTSGEKAYRIYNFKGAYVGTFKASDMTSLKNEVQKSNVKAGAYMVRSLDGHVNRLIEIKK